MFLNGHHLNAVIAIFDDAGQHIVLEFCVGSNFLGILSHTHMAFIYKQWILFGLECFLFPLVWLGRIPDLSGENLCLLVLYHTTAPGRNTLTFSPIPLHFHFIELPVFESLFTELQLPITSTFNALTTIFLGFRPIIKVANQIDVCGIGSPFTKHPAFCEFVQSEIQMTCGKVGEFFLAILC